jgi:hypothetical protein
MRKNFPLGFERQRNFFGFVQLDHEAVLNIARHFAATVAFDADRAI